MSTDNRNPKQLEREADLAREQLSQTVDAISNKLSPGQLLDQVMGVTREHGGELVSNLTNQAKQNPLALLLTGVGAAWLFAENSNRSGTSSVRDEHATRPRDPHATSLESGDATESPGVTDKIKSTAASVSEAVSDTAQALSDKASRTSDAATTKAAETRDQLTEKASALRTQATGQYQRVMQEQPLVAGALGVALGAALGALIPPSDAEDRYLGSSSDAMKDKALDAADDEYVRVRESVKQQAETLKSANA